MTEHQVSEAFIYAMMNAWPHAHLADTTLLNFYFTWDLGFGRTSNVSLKELRAEIERRGIEV